MQYIARDRLLDLREQQITIAHDEIANGLTPVGSGMKLGARQPRRRARQLQDRSREAVFYAEAGDRKEDTTAGLR
jgi:hypothetical protein